MSDDATTKHISLPSKLFVNYVTMRSIAEDLSEGKEIGPTSMKGFGFAVLSLMESWEWYIDYVKENKVDKPESFCKACGVYKSQHPLGNCEGDFE